MRNITFVRIGFELALGAFCGWKTAEAIYQIIDEFVDSTCKQVFHTIDI